jgi:glycosyltransferase involved in cell wall biosynthesis
VRVALVCDWFLPRVGGIELHLRDLALALRQRGLDARIVTTTRGPVLVNGVPVHRVPALLAPGAGFAFTPGALGGVARVIRGEQFDVVHAHASVISPVAYAGAVVGAQRGLPTVLTFHSMLYQSAFLLGASEALLGWSRERIVLSAVSSVVAAQAARWLPDASVAVLPNGVDVEFWRGGEHQRRDDADVLFVSAMRLSRKKRPAMLLRAFAAATRFVHGTPSLRLVIAGDGPDREALHRYALALGIGDRVELPGQVSRAALRALYARADVFVLPSERESFGIAALEARAAGLPVIAMLASGARDFIHQGVDGLLVADERDLTRAIERMALDTPFRAWVTRRNGSTAPPYDWTDVAAQHERVYVAAAELRSAGDRASQR